MNLLNLAKRLERLIPDDYRYSLTSILGFLRTNSTMSQLTKHLSLEQNIQLSIYLNAIVKGQDLKVVEWFSKNLYMVDVICFENHPYDMECDECNGRGEFDCSYCGGSGSQHCGECDGDGEVENGEGNMETCDWCDGDGSEDCGDCGGSGTESCGACDGSGEVDGPDNVPGVELRTYLGFNPKIMDKLSLMEKEGKEVKEKLTTFLQENFIDLGSHQYNDNDLYDVDEVPEERWGKCFVNNIYEFDGSVITPSFYRKKYYALHVNDVLLDTPNP